MCISLPAEACFCGVACLLPQPKDWSIKMNKKERRLALATALQSAAADTIVVDDLSNAVPDGKTKTLVSVLASVGAAPDKKTLLIVKDAGEKLTLAGRNVAKLSINSAAAIHVSEVMHGLVKRSCSTPEH